MAFSVETQVKAKNTYALLVYSLSEVGALFGTGSFVKAAVLDLAAFDASATLLAVAANLASLSLSITIVFGVHAGISKVLHRVATGTYSQPQGDVDTQST